MITKTKRENEENSLALIKIKKKSVKKNYQKFREMKQRFVFTPVKNLGL